MFLWQKITGFLIGFIENSEKAHMAVLGWINRQALQLIHKESYDEVQEQLQQFNQVIEAKQMSLELNCSTLFLKCVTMQRTWATGPSNTVMR